MHMIVAALLVAALQTTPAAPPAAQPQTAVSPAPAGSMAPAPVPATSAAPAPAAPANGMAGQPSFGDLISSLNNMRTEIAQIRAMNGTSANNLQPVNVAQLSGSDPSQLNSAIARNQAQLNQLRSALGRVTLRTDTNQRITVAQFLSDNKMTTSQIVGAMVRNGKLVLFYRKP